MKRALVRIVLLLVFCLSLSGLLERYNSAQIMADYQLQQGAQLERLQLALQQQLDGWVLRNQQLAQALADKLQADKFPDEAWLGTFAGDPAPGYVTSISYTRKLKIFRAWPTEGNESVIGMDYGLRAEFAESVRRSIARNTTTLDGPVLLQQSNRPGLIIRTPFHHSDGSLAGLAVFTLDIEQLLQAVEIEKIDARMGLVVRWHHRERGVHPLYGNNMDDTSGPKLMKVMLPDQNYWEISANPAVWLEQHLAEQNDRIRLFVILLFVLLLWLLLRNSPLLELEESRPAGLSLRNTLLLAIMLPLLILLAGFSFISYTRISVAQQQQMHEQAEQLAKQLHVRLQDVFSIPRQAMFNAELFRQRILDPQKPAEMLSFFMAQMRLQPFLNFLSMSNVQGEYHAVSRAPTGGDNSLRLQWATLATGRAMHLHWATDANTPSELFLVGNPNFDARLLPWFQQAMRSQRLGWYAPYRYTTHDPRGQYEGYGIGVSAPVFDLHNNFIGVINADLSLSRIHEFLYRQAHELGGTLFLMEASGKLLASSTRPDQSALRQPASLTLNPLVGEAARTIEAASTPSGNRLININGRRHALDWQRIKLDDGPFLTLVVVLPPGWLEHEHQKSFRELFFISAYFLIACVLLALFASYWLATPLHQLERWAHDIRKGRREPASRLGRTPIKEVASLSRSLDSMAQQLQNQAIDLEHKVAQRTEELANANAQLMRLSQTDGLTGVANRRCFDETLANEWQRARREGNSLGLLMIDIDWFKAYNDDYGHQAGDTALIRVASVLDAFARRPGDLVARYGGEEFVFITTGANTEGLQLLADNLCKAVFGLGLEHQKSPYARVSISIGAALMTSAKHPDFDTEQLIALADAAMYQAKHAGRNQVVIECLC